MKFVRIFLWVLIWLTPIVTLGITGIVTFGNDINSEAVRIICSFLFWSQCSIIGLTLADNFNKWFKSQLKDK